MATPQVVGRYAIYGEIAVGGMATVHLGRMRGAVGFSRTVAVKRMHPEYADDPEFVSMFVNEAKLAARIRHPNVVPTIDIVATKNELFLVLEFIHGETLARLLRQAAASNTRIPVPIVTAILSGVLHGLHAAHEARDERGEPLGIVHRDISPQNVIVGVDGISRVLDFGIAKAVNLLQTTRSGQMKGKIGYMAPEQLEGETITRRCDVYSASVVLWEALSGRRLFHHENERIVIERVLHETVAPPSTYAPGAPRPLDAIVLRGLSRDPKERFPTAREMATALEACGEVAIPPAVGAWLEKTVPEALAAQAASVAEIEGAPDDGAADSDARVTAEKPTAEPPPSVAAVHPGSVIAGKYRVDGLLGAGGMGRVLAATHLQLDTKVALKFMRREAMTSPGSAQRFTREARAAVKLKSEHVAKVLDVGTLEDGTPYIVMELLEGRDLEALLAERRALSIAEAAEYVLHACDAIAEAHALGIVHRDLKPANLFVTHGADGAPVVKVVDFGVSKATTLDDAEGGVTRTSAIVGSPSYMSPEQLECSRSVDARADVWSLGVILYEITSGRLPFVGDSLPRLIAAILTDDLVPLRQLRRDVPPAFDALVASCLARRREQRCPSVTDVARALAPFAPPRCRAVMERIEALAGRSSQGTGPLAYPPVPAKTMGGMIVSEPTVRAGTAMRASAARSSVVTQVLAAAGAVLVVVGLGGGGLALRSAARSRAHVTPADTQDPPPPPPSLPQETQPPDSPTASAPPVASTSASTAASATPAPSAKGHEPRSKHTPAVPPKPAQSAYNPLEHL